MCYVNDADPYVAGAAELSAIAGMTTGQKMGAIVAATAGLDLTLSNELYANCTGYSSICADANVAAELGSPTGALPVMLAADALFDYDALAPFYDAGTAPGTAAATLSAAIKGDANNQCAGLEATWAVADHTFDATKAAMKAALDMGINATTDTQNAFIAALVAANFTTESFAGASAQVAGKNARGARRCWSCWTWARFVLRCCCQGYPQRCLR